MILDEVRSYVVAQKGPTLRSEQILIIDGQRMSCHHPEALSFTHVVRRLMVDSDLLPSD